jgi:hypothetical protein|tara:strand:+ start:401 stop:514 length:114 start_codon:yes stop_codon:yes gene_type:complete
MLLVEMQYVESGFEPVWELIPAGLVGFEAKILPKLGK